MIKLALVLITIFGISLISYIGLREMPKEDRKKILSLLLFLPVPAIITGIVIAVIQLFN